MGTTQLAAFPTCASQCARAHTHTHTHTHSLDLEFADSSLPRPVGPWPVNTLGKFTLGSVPSQGESHLLNGWFRRFEGFQTLQAGFQLLQQNHQGACQVDRLRQW